MRTVISAKVICDSLSPLSNHRLTTIEATFPRFILAEVNTHRKFSRNSASSRAIPIEKQIAKVLDDPFIPIHWGKNQPGMQAREEVDADTKYVCEYEWLEARYSASLFASRLASQGIHKQIVNRLIEPFLWHTCIISSTEWQNFFNQRCHPDAEPHMQALAYAIRGAIEESTPVMVPEGGWHMPYIQEEELKNQNLVDDVLKRVSVARCARVSYLTHDGKRDIEKDLDLFYKLTSHKPMHYSPLEHVATPGRGTGNFDGWNQLRAQYEEENRGAY